MPEKIAGTDGELNYNDRTTRATAEQNDLYARPAIQGSGLGRMEETLQELVPAAVVRDGRFLSGRIHTEELKKRADNLEK